MKKINSKQSENRSIPTENENLIANDKTENKKWKYVFIALSALIFICMMCVAFTAGSAGDDILDGHHGHTSLDYYLHHDTTCVRTFEGINYSDPDALPHLKYYGSGFEMIPAAIVRCFSIPQYELLIRRIIIGLCGFLLMLTIGFIAKTIKDWKLASFAIVTTALTPTVFGLSFIASKDIPFALGVTLAILGMIRFCRNLPEIKIVNCLLIMGGVMICVSVRIGGLILFPYFAFIFILTYALRKDLRKSIVAAPLKFLSIVGICILICFAGAFLGLCAYPNFFYEGPVSHVKNAITLVSKFPFDIPFVFEGKMYSALSRPEHYLLKSLMITLPLFVLMGAVLFVLFSYRIFKKYDIVVLLFLLFAALFPLFYVTITNATIYNGWRHLLFFYPPFVICVSMGWYEFTEIFSSAKKKLIHTIPYVIFVAALSPVLVWMISNPRYTYSYYNEFVPNPYLKYELDYFETSATETYDWFRKNELPKCDSVVTMSTKIQTPTYYAQMLGDTDRVKVFTTSYMGFAETDCDYSIINYHIIQPKAIKKFFPPKGTIQVEYVDGNPVCALVKRNKLDSKGIRLCKEGKYAEGVKLLDSAYQYDPNNFGIWFWLAMAHFQTHDYEKSIEFFNKDLNFMATNEKYAMASMYNGASLYELKRYDEAIKTLQTAERVCTNPKDLPFIKAHLGMAYFAKEQYAEAIPYFQAVIPTYPFLAGQLNYCMSKR